MSIYSVVKDPGRGKRPVRDEPRAQESGAKSISSPAEVSPQATYSGEARVPKSIVQEGKKGIRGLMIVFMEIRAVTGFSGEMSTRRNQRVSRCLCRNKVTGEMRVRRKVSLFRRKTLKHN